MNPMNKIIIANWKMNPSTVQEAATLAKKIDVADLVIAAPAPFLGVVGSAIKKAKLGAQNVFWEDQGPFTGEVSASQLASVGVSYVIVGHSERRRLGETDEMIARKISVAIHNRLIPIICVGETRGEHEIGQSESVVKKQLEIDLSLLSKTHYSTPIIIAYEPVWAISTEKNAQPDTPENAVAMINSIKQVTDQWPQNTTFIYGGSVNPNNAESFLKHKEIEGALVGGASLKAEEMKAIIEISRKY